MKFSRLLLVLGACAAILQAQVFAAPTVFDPDPPGVPVVNPGDEPESETAERLEALAERFGPRQGEAYKAALAALVKQHVAQYGDQLPGGKAKGIPKWKSIGPTSAQYQTNAVTLAVSDSGRVRRVLQNRKDSDRVYVLTSGGGLWSTDNFGDRNPEWKALTDSQFNTSGGNMAMGRKAKTLYVGLGDPFDAVPTLTGGMIKTKDDGKKWSPFVPLTGANTVRDVAVDITASDDIVLVATDAGVFRSSDAGETYAAVLAMPTWSFVNTSAGWLVSGANGVIYRSTNKGATWAPIPNTGTKFTGAGRTTLAVGADGDAVVYAFAATTNDIEQLDLFRSTDGGLSWTALGLATKTPVNPNDFQPDMNIMADQAFYNQMLLVDPSDSKRNTVYIGGQLASAKSSDGGKTWTLVSDWLPTIFSNLPYVHADHHTAAMIYVDDRPGIVFGTDGGIFISTNGGGSFDFQKNNGIVSWLAQTVISSTTYPQSLLLGMQDTGTRARLNATTIYNQVTGGDGEGVGWSQANNFVALTTAAGGVVFRADNLKPDTIGNWRRVTPGLVVGDSRQFFTKIATPTAIADPSGAQFLTSTRRRLYITIDGARASASWLVLARSGSRWPATFSVRDTHHGIGLDPTADFSKPGPFGRIAVAGSGGQVAQTLDFGATWKITSLIGLVPGWQGFNASTAWTKTGTLFVASESPLIGSTRVVRTADNGVTWQRADGGLPDVPVFHVVIDPSDVTGKSLFAATSLGVFATTDSGANWKLFGARLPTVRAMGLDVTADGNVIRVATYGRGAWEINKRGEDDEDD
jgi:hypothetical protein